MGSCKCGLGNSVDHESILESNTLEIKRLRWSESFKVAKPKVVGLLEENISIAYCIGRDVSNLESKLSEYENKKGIRKSTQLGPRKIHPDTAHSKHTGNSKKIAEKKRKKEEYRKKYPERFPKNERKPKRKGRRL